MSGVRKSDIIKVGELAKVQPGGMVVGGSGFLWRVESPEVCLLPHDLDLGVPLHASAVERHPSKTRLVASQQPDVPLVLRRGRRSQVLDSVVGLDPILVIDLDGEPSMVPYKHNLVCCPH